MFFYRQMTTDTWLNYSLIYCNVEQAVGEVYDLYATWHDKEDNNGSVYCKAQLEARNSGKTVTVCQDKHDSLLQA